MVDGKTILTYNETNPFVVNYFGFAVVENGDESRFYYNCKLNSSNDVSNSNRFQGIPPTPFVQVDWAKPRDPNETHVPRQDALN